MIFFYENSKGEIIDFLKKPYRAIEADIYDTTWTSSSEGYEKKLEIDVMDENSDFRNNMNKLYDLLAADAESGVYGKLWVNGSYISCFLKKKETTGWKSGVYAYVTLTFYAPELSWITEERKTFFAGMQQAGADGLDYPRDYPYDYSGGTTGKASWDIENISECEFSMIVYGACVNPEILINGHTYKVETTIESGEYMIIDSQTRTIYKHIAAGTNISLFNNRSTQESVFQKISPGINDFEWSGAFSFEIIVYKSRREPKWN